MTLKSISAAVFTLALATMPMAAQAGTSDGNPTFKSIKGALTTGRGGPQSAKIGSYWDCWTDANGNEHCEPFLIWCPNDRDPCISTED